MKRKSIGFFYAINFWELHYGYGRPFLSKRAGQRELSPEHPAPLMSRLTWSRDVERLPCPTFDMYPSWMNGVNA